MRSKIFSVLFGIFSAALCFTALAYGMSRTQIISDMKELDAATDRISACLSNAFAYMDILELSIQFDGKNYSKKKFQKLTDKALEKNTCIASFQLAPDAVVAYINPLEGNEEALGLDLLQDDASKKFVLKAMDSDTLVIQGPVESVQGSTLIFGRKAVWINRAFWGVATIAIDFDELLEECGLSKMQENVDLCISSYNSNNKLSYVWGNENLMNKSFVYSDIELLHQRWRITVSRKLKFAEMLRGYGIYIVASLIVGAAVYILSSYFFGRINASKRDHLTQTLNRVSFQKQAERKLRRNHQMCALLAIDMDKFKYINDTYGHLAGDKVLICTAERMKHAVRKTDLISRVGGDEYMIFLSHLHTHKQLMSVINRIRHFTEQEIHLKEHTVSVGISIGYAIAPEEGTDYKKLYEIADKRMYEDKAMRK
jgi:diguanylate cyclase (GGDEF)-like protein